MSQRVTIDPVTRIEGHLRVDVEVDCGKVKKAWASGQMWRGVENILIGRDPRDAWAITQRICGGKGLTSKPVKLDVSGLSAPLLQKNSHLKKNTKGMTL